MGVKNKKNQNEEDWLDILLDEETGGVGKTSTHLRPENSQEAPPPSSVLPFKDSKENLKAASGKGDAQVLPSIGESNHLKVAQDRVIELENFLSKLSHENDELLSTNKYLTEKVSVLKSNVENLKQNYDEQIVILKEDNEFLNKQLLIQKEKAEDFEEKYESLQNQIRSDLQRVRVRERELENRLELLKVENSAISKNKDELILDLKREVDQLKYELENVREKYVKIQKSLTHGKEKSRRTIRALRLAMHMLDSEDIEKSITNNDEISEESHQSKTNRDGKGQKS